MTDETNKGKEQNNEPEKDRPQIDYLFFAGLFPNPGELLPKSKQEYERPFPELAAKMGSPGDDVDRIVKFYSEYLPEVLRADKRQGKGPAFLNMDLVEKLELVGSMSYNKDDLARPISQAAIYSSQDGLGRITNESAAAAQFYFSEAVETAAQERFRALADSADKQLFEQVLGQKPIDHPSLIEQLETRSTPDVPLGRGVEDMCRGMQQRAYRLPSLAYIVCEEDDSHAFSAAFVMAYAESNGYDCTFLNSEQRDAQRSDQLNDMVSKAKFEGLWKMQIPAETSYDVVPFAQLTGDGGDTKMLAMARSSSTPDMLVLIQQETAVPLVVDRDLVKFYRLPRESNPAVQSLEKYLGS